MQVLFWSHYITHILIHVLVTRSFIPRIVALMSLERKRQGERFWGRIWRPKMKFDRPNGMLWNTHIYICIYMLSINIYWEYYMCTYDIVYRTMLEIGCAFKLGR